MRTPGLPERAGRFRRWLLVLSGSVCSLGCTTAGSGQQSGRPDAGRHARRAQQEKPATTGPVIDCDLLERALRTCSLQVVAAADPKLPERLTAIPKDLRQSVARGVRDGLVFRIVAPCRQYHGSMPQTTKVAQCLELFKKEDAAGRARPEPPRKPERKGSAGGKPEARTAAAPTGEDPCMTFAACLTRVFEAGKSVLPAARKAAPPAGDRTGRAARVDPRENPRPR